MENGETVLLSKLLDLSMQRQQAIASNIANANTPGYLRQKLVFEQTLAQHLESRDMKGLAAVQGELQDDMTSPPRADGNNVQLGNEMNDLVQNSVYHQLLTRALATKMRIARLAMS